MQLIRILLLLSALFLSGCVMGSPKNAFAIKTEDYGQCRSLEEGEKVYYKKRLVKYMCEDRHVLINKPYEKEGQWYFKAGLYDGKKVHKAEDAKVIATMHKRCQLQGAYGTGDQKIRKFYLDRKTKACTPFIWSGEGGIAPFDSKADCRFECFELR